MERPDQYRQWMLKRVLELDKEADALHPGFLGPIKFMLMSEEQKASYRSKLDVLKGKCIMLREAAEAFNQVFGEATPHPNPNLN